MNRIEPQFESYRKEVVPREATESQLIETRRAFYAGAAAMFLVINQIAGIEDEKAGEDAMNEIVKELEQFPAQVQKGGRDGLSNRISVAAWMPE